MGATKWVTRLTTARNMDTGSWVRATNWNIPQRKPRALKNVARRTPEQRQKTIRANVRQILKDHPDARNNDGVLCWLYTRTYHKIDLPWIDFKTLTTLDFDSIARSRRYWQNRRRQFLPTDPRVREARQRKSQAMKAIFGN